MTDIKYEKLKILVIDDETFTLSLIKGLLRQLRIGVIVDARNGSQGLKQVVEYKPHIVLCDVNMQPVNGREFLAKLRTMAQDGVHETPVVFLTADASRDTVLFAKEHAANGYLVKPVSMTALKARVDAIAEPLAL